MIQRFHRYIVTYLLINFLFVSIVSPIIHAQTLNLPQPGVMISLTPSYTPARLVGMTIDPVQPFQFDFYIDPGDEHLNQEALAQESTRLIKYFLTSLALPEEEMWVNLSPYEKNRIIPESFGQTEMGRDVLAQDYLLKQLSASLIYPEKDLGREFWERVYDRAHHEYGTHDIPLDTLHKVWIIPAQATVQVKNNSVFVLESRLRVMLEEDYKNQPVEREHTLSSEIIREVIIPEIEREVNEGKTFSPLRQICHSMILATWFKNNLRKSLLGQLYVDQKKVKGIELDDKTIKEKIYSQYVEAFQKGVYNYIVEEFNPMTQERIPRKYFSGGFQGSYQALVQEANGSSLASDLFKVTARFISPETSLATFDALPKQDKLYLNNGNNEIMAELGQLFLELILEYFAQIKGEQVNVWEHRNHLIKKLRELDLPKDPKSLEEILDKIIRIMDANLRFNESFIAQMNGQPLAMSILTNVLIDHLNLDMSAKDGENLETARAVEQQTLQWLTHMLGYTNEEASPGGLMTSGGTSANLLAFAAARNRALHKHWNQFNAAQEGLMGKEAPEIVILTSGEYHYSQEKAFNALGLGSVRMVKVDIDDDYRMDIEDLKFKVEELKKQGKIIAAIVGVVSSTKTGSIDPIKEIIEVAKDKDVDAFVHIDAASGGPLLLSNREEMQQLHKTMALADSITLDPHKFLFTPYETGVLLFRDEEESKKYLAGAMDDPDIEQEFFAPRRFDALKIYSAIQWMGIENIQKLVDHLLDMTHYFETMFVHSPQEFEILTPAETNIFNIRYVPEELRYELDAALARDDIDEVNGINEMIDLINSGIAEQMQSQGDIYTSMPILRGTKYRAYGDREEPNEIQSIRIVVMSPSTTPEDLHELFRKIRNIGREIATKWHYKTPNIVEIPIPKLKLSVADPREFQDYFMHSDNVDLMRTIGEKIIRMITHPQEGEALSKTDFDQLVQQAQPPNQPTNVDEVLKTLKFIYSNSLSDAHQAPPFISSLASLIYSSMNPNQIAAEVSPESTVVENEIIEWLLQYVGYPIGNEELSPGGIFSNGQMTSFLTMLVVARNVWLHNMKNVNGHEQGIYNLKDKGVVITTASDAQMIKTAAGITGIGSDNVIVIDDESTLADILQTMEDQKSKGLDIIAINVSANIIQRETDEQIMNQFLKEFETNWINITTTNEKEIFIDGLNGLNQQIYTAADSMVLDVQKLFHAPVGIGVTLFKQVLHLEGAMDERASYIFSKEKREKSSKNIGQRSLEGSKSFRLLSLLVSLWLMGPRELIQSDPLGGIDLNAQHFELKTIGDEMQWSTIVDPIQLKNIHIDGLIPSIINITPVSHLPQ